MPMKDRALVERIGFALSGWRAAWRRERSVRIQVYIAGFALLALLMLHPAPIWWAVAALTMALILALELIQCAFESVIDLVHPDRHETIRVARNMIAGAVLAIDIAAIVIAIALIVARVPLLIDAYRWGAGR